MPHEPKDLGELIKGLDTQGTHDAYFAFKVSGLDVLGKHVHGIQGTLMEKGIDYLLIDTKADGPVLIPQEQIAYIAGKPLSPGSETTPLEIPPEISAKLNPVEERMFRYLLNKDGVSFQELTEASKTTAHALKGHIPNLRKKLQGTPYEFKRGERGYGIKDNRTQSPAYTTEDQILTFEKFTERDVLLIPRYNNFILYFATSGVGLYMREEPFFDKFQKEHPLLEERLRAAVTSRKRRAMTEALKPFDKDLYAAYLIMRFYGASNGKLIGGS